MKVGTNSLKTKVNPPQRLSSGSASITGEVVFPHGVVAIAPVAIGGKTTPGEKAQVGTTQPEGIKLE